MTERFVYRFDWDLSKAMANWHKHGVSFEVAATVLRDTLGQSETGQLVVVVHTFEESSENALVRIISARYATANERRQYASR
jgi:uncharacterized DUF497 family protein